MPAGELARKLKGPGLQFHSGPFVTRLTSGIRSLVPSFQRAYAHFHVAADGEVADFALNVRNSGGLRRWVRRQAIPDVDAPAPFVPLPERQASVMLEMGLNWMVATRAARYLILHAAVVERSGKSLIIPGQSGQGKSTLCAGLAGRGWRCFSDEFAFIDLARHETVPYPRPISLKNRSIEVIREFAPDLEFAEVLHGTPKGTMGYIRPKREWVDRAHEAAPCAGVVFPHYEPDAELKLRPMAEGDVLMQLTMSGVNCERHGGAAFETLGALVNRCPGYRLFYSDLEAAVKTLAGLVDE